MTEEQDELFGKAAEVVIKSGKVSTSFIQRDLQIGYNRAARIIEQLEKSGIVSPANQVGKRTVTERGYKSLNISEKIMNISKESGVLPEDVLEVAEELVGIGHNSGDEPHSSVTKAAINGDAQDIAGIAGQRLKSFVERVERLEEEKAAMMEDIKEVYAEAKGVGYDVKTMRKLVKLRKMDTEKRREMEDILDLYKSAVGMI